MNTKRRGGALAAMAIVAFTLGSCQRTHYAEQIRNIDSLLVVLDSSRNTLRNIDTTGYGQAMLDYNQRMDTVQALYIANGDTMDHDAGMLMASFRELKKPLEKFTTRYEETGTELEFSRSQLLDLKHDLEHNLLDTNVVNRMLREESQAVDRVRLETTSLETSHNTTKKKSDLLTPKVDSLLNRLQAPGGTLATEDNTDTPTMDGQK